ncbi:MAG: Lrp/AsnC family transcriptional regulator [Deltaproteobacteria bacterium]|jgi:DNA-binding Lrp family transcriptional regulator|nr:Lrp/AsnC family transcriptional regulator [Deltaproteobacteria bacterium]
MKITPEELDGGSISESTGEEELSQQERELLSLIQSGFPLEPRPYAVLGAQIGVSEQEALELTRKLRQKKIIRRMGANFRSDKIGFRSTLCAAKVTEDKMDAFVKAVNDLPWVTHNYLRDHAYNVWFTLICPSWERVLETLRELEQSTGVPVLNLPATKMYKIKVDFDLS